MDSDKNCFDPFCEKCTRLAGFLSEIRATHPNYHGRPVQAFGDSEAKLVVVGLAPGMHGANASGRPFTGDFAGILLYRTLFEFGFSNHPESFSRDDGLVLKGCLITNAVKCLPPQNKPVAAEIYNCNPYLKSEFELLPASSVILALGGIAHQAVLRAFDLRLKQFPFKHAAIHNISDSKVLVDCYHCSRYNIQTKRLTPEMFKDVFRMIMKLLEKDLKS